MERTIKVTGRGNINLKPDLTIIELRLTKVEEGYHNTLGRATSDVAEVKNKLVELGFNRNDLKTTYFNVNTEYQSYKDNNGNWATEFVGYRYNQTLKFSFDVDNKLLGKVLYALGGLKCSPKFDIIYTVKDDEEAKNLLLKYAVKDANRKAQIIAEASNLNLGDILSIDYSFMSVEFSERIFDNKMDLINGEIGCNNSLNVDFEPDDIKANDTITVLYAIK